MEPDSMRLSFLMLLLILLFIQEMKAQLNGTIRDGVTDEHMEYVTVALFNESDVTLVTGVISDSKELFTIEVVRRGNYYLEVSLIGYALTVISTFAIKQIPSIQPIPMTS